MVRNIYWPICMCYVCLVCVFFVFASCCMRYNIFDRTDGKIKARGTSPSNEGFKNSLNNFCNAKCKLFWKYFLFLRDEKTKYLGNETPGHVIQLLLKEIIEVFTQIIAFYYYAGSQNSLLLYISGQEVNLAVQSSFVKLFSIFISLDCVILSLIWIIYLFKYNTFKIYLFIFILFINDTLFDLFFTLFPLFLLNNPNSFSIIVGSLSTDESFITFISTFLPMIFLTIKLNTLLSFLNHKSVEKFDKIYNPDKYIKIKNDNKLLAAMKRLKTFKTLKSLQFGTTSTTINSNKQQSSLSNGTLTKMPPLSATIKSVPISTGLGRRVPTCSVSTARAPALAPLELHLKTKSSTHESDNDSDKDCDNSDNDQQDEYNDKETNLDTLVSSKTTTRNENNGGDGYLSKMADQPVLLKPPLHGGSHKATCTSAISVPLDHELEMELEQELEGISHVAIGHDSLAKKSNDLGTTSGNNGTLTSGMDDGSIRVDTNHTGKTDMPKIGTGIVLTKSKSLNMVNDMRINSCLNQEELEEDDEMYQDNCSDKQKCWLFCCHGPLFLNEIPEYNNNDIDIDENANNKLIFIIEWCRRISLIIFSLTLMIIGIYIVTTTFYHLDTRSKICDEYNEYTNGYNNKYPHLYVWPYCNYKTYPTSDEIPCNCRSLYFNIEIDDINNIINNYNESESEESEEEGENDILSNIIQSIFINYYMLETLYIQTPEIGTLGNLSIDNNYLNAKQLKALYIEGINIPYINDYDISISYKNLQFLSLTSIGLQLMPYNGLSKLYNLRYLDLSQDGLYTLETNLTKISNELKFLCQLNELQTIILPGNGNIILPNCLYESNIALKLHTVVLNTALNIDLKISDKPNFRIFIALYSNINTSDIKISDFNNFEYNNIENIQYYLQGTPLCNHWVENVLLSNDDDNIENAEYEYSLNYPIVYNFLNKTNACDTQCNDLTDNIIYYTCEPYNWQNGDCDNGCNFDECNYDGGDCIQLCNFDECTLDMLNNGICNQECNNEYCNYDYCDCESETGTSGNNITCSDTFNYIDCYRNTNCSIILNDDFIFYNYNNNNSIIRNDTIILYEDINDELSWINDGFCDNNCNNKECNYDGNDCIDCDESNSYQCATAWLAFNIVSNSENDDYLISLSEGCTFWSYVSTLGFILDDSKAQNNCTYGMNIYDLNNDTYLNFYEIMLAFYNFDNNYTVIDKDEQINCSFCMPDVNMYNMKAET